ncbi:MAG: 3-oxoacyl-(Acyl-carrier-protein) synthase [Bradyrhizobium sp.]|nr:3-oxoacyl-(Acyl-carrier-protein) synthase [Bradyrhizobium sp.]
MMRVSIEAIASALPEKIVTNADLEREYPSWELSRLLSRTGVEERRIAAPDETALDLGYRACQALDARGALKPDEIDALIFCTETPDYPLPPNSSVLHGMLKLSPQVMAFDITLACSGFVYALGIARSLVLSGTARRVLIVTADTYSRLIHRGDRSSRCLFGDGGAATIVSSGPGLEVLDVKFNTAGERYDKFIVRAGGSRAPRSSATGETVTDRSGNIRTAEHIEMDGLGVLSFFASVVPQAVKLMLESHGLSKDDISCYVFHQASQVALEGVGRGLGISKDRMIFNLAKIGNLVSASVPVALEAAINEGRLKPDQKAVLCGFGVGLSWATALVRM